MGQHPHGMQAELPALDHNAGAFSLVTGDMVPGTPGVEGTHETVQSPACPEEGIRTFEEQPVYLQKAPKDRKLALLQGPGLCCQALQNFLEQVPCLYGIGRQLGPSQQNSHELAT